MSQLQDKHNSINANEVVTSFQRNLAENLTFSGVMHEWFLFLFPYFLLNNNLLNDFSLFFLAVLLEWKIWVNLIATRPNTAHRWDSME